MMKRSYLGKVERKEDVEYLAHGKVMDVVPAFIQLFIERPSSYNRFVNQY